MESPDPKQRCVPKACVVLKPGAPPNAETARNILALVRSRLAPYQKIMDTDRDSLMRLTLWLSAAANLGVAGLVLFPASVLAQFAGLPAEPVPALYRTLLALFIALFGAAYAWLARQVVVSRAFVAFAATGKFLAFSITLLLWMTSLTPGRWALLMAGDLVLAAVFVVWLVNGREASASRAP